MTDHEPWSALRVRLSQAKKGGNEREIWDARAAIARYRVNRIRRMLEEAKRKSA